MTCGIGIYASGVMSRLNIDKINSRNKRIVADFGRGNRAPMLAKKYGLAEKQVYRIIKETRERSIEKRNSAIFSDYMSKKSVKEIACRYGMTEQYVKRVIGKEYLRRHNS